MLGNRQDQGSTGNYIPQDTGFDGGSSQNMIEILMTRGVNSKIWM